MPFLFLSEQMRVEPMISIRCPQTSTTIPRISKFRGIAEPSQVRLWIVLQVFSVDSQWLPLTNMAQSTFYLPTPSSPHLVPVVD